MNTKHGLKRNLKKLDTLALSFGAMIGWSWVALSTEIIGRGGSVGGILGTLLVGFIILAIVVQAKYDVRLNINRR